MADSVFECSLKRFRWREFAWRVAVFQAALLLCFLAPIPPDIVAQISHPGEGGWGRSAGGLFVATAQAKGKKKKQFDDDNDGPFQGYGFGGFQGSGYGSSQGSGYGSSQGSGNGSSQGSGVSWQGMSSQGNNAGSIQAGGGSAQAISSKQSANDGKDSDQKSNTDGQKQGNDDGRRGDDDASGGNKGSGRTAGGSKGPTAGPPRTVAELLQRWFNPKKQAMPAWPEAKVSRAAADPVALAAQTPSSVQGPSPVRLPVVPAQAPAPSNAKIAQKPPAQKHAPRSLLADNLLALPGTFRPNELLVQRPSEALLKRLAENGWEPRPSAAQGVTSFVSTRDPVAERERLLRELPGERLGLNFVYHVANGSLSRRPTDARVGGAPCDPQRCYGPPLINWQPKLAACAEGVTIGIIDTAVDVAHPSLRWKGLRVIRMPSQDPADAEPHWHGTAVTSLLAGRPDSGTPGLIPDANYVITDAFAKNAAGNPETSTANLLWALDRLEERGAQVINMSLSGPQDPLVHERLIELSRKGVVFVAAAGNGGVDAPSAYPAAYKDEVIAVTAVDRDKRVFDQANRGDYIDVAAPGVRIWTALPNSKEGLSSGTSFAAPFVTALVATIYKETLAPAMGGSRAARNAEAVTLAHLPTARIERDDEVGLGLVSAPSNCAGNLRPVPMAQWETQVHFVSAKP